MSNGSNGFIKCICGHEFPMKFMQHVKDGERKPQGSNITNYCPMCTKRWERFQ